jgi:hypothetical protein
MNQRLQQMPLYLLLFLDAAVISAVQLMFLNRKTMDLQL